jgi:hypothetical protein
LRLRRNHRPHTMGSAKCQRLCLCLAGCAPPPPHHAAPPLRRAAGAGRRGARGQLRCMLCSRGPILCRPSHSVLPTSWVVALLQGATSQSVGQNPGPAPLLGAPMRVLPRHTLGHGDSYWDACRWHCPCSSGNGRQRLLARGVQLGLILHASWTLEVVFGATYRCAGGLATVVVTLWQGCWG